jgi:hypothetical protein
MLPLWFRHLQTNSMPRRLLFDLDRTLWRRYTVEYDHLPFDAQRVADDHVPLVHTHMLKELARDGHHLHVCSRSSEPEKCEELLRVAFPAVPFRSLHIYPTHRHKLTHVLAALGTNDANEAREEPFWFFDDEPHILQHLSETFPKATLVHTPGGIIEGVLFNANGSENTAT